MRQSCTAIIGPRNGSWVGALPDALTGLGCLTLLAILVYFLHRRRDVPFRLLFGAFGVFLAGSGVHYFVMAFGGAAPPYPGAVVVKLSLALALGVVIARLVPLLPQSVALRSPEAVARELAEQRRAEEALRVSEERFRLLVESANDFAMFMLDVEGHVTTWNEGAQRVKGYRASEIIGRHFSCFYDEEDRRLGTPARALEQAVADGRAEEEGWRVRRDGSRFWANSIVTALREAGGARRGFTLVTRDVTGRKQLEEQLYQAQKMEAVGRLAGGVAHDFNNVLTVVTGYSDILLNCLAPDDPSHAVLREILKAGERAAGLTRQLLAFSRKQVLAPKVLDLNAVIAETEKMLRRLIGEDIQLRTVADPHLGRVKADPGQVDQVLLNLAVNARDAMPQGGRLTIETRNADLEAAHVRAHPDVRPGPYVLLSVSDTGCGMDEHVRAHLFEPFFTTKEVGKGTGLGLATVYGIVKQSGGHIEVFSTPGKGTTFNVYLPRVAEEVAAAAPKAVARPCGPGSETVLVVEDEAALKDMICLVLRKGGYTVLEARDGGRALRLAQQHRGPIDLLLTDMVMPLMNGFQLAQHLTAARPGLKVLYMSGYTDSAFVRGGVALGEIELLQKPFSPDGLACKVREVLDKEALVPAGPAVA